MNTSHSGSTDIYVFRKDIDIDLLRNLITLIDGYLINYFDDFTLLEQKIKVGALGPELAKEWKYIGRSLMRIANTVKRIPGLVAIIKLCTIFRILALLFTMSGTGLIISTQFAGSPSYLYYMSILFLTFSAISITWYRILERKISTRIRDYFEKHQTKYGSTRGYLRSSVQKLIFSMANYLKVKRIDPEKYPLSLYNTDYEGVKIVRKRGLLRSKSKVIVSID
jgi:hypothetical protein